jgi:hypothetical protein
MRKGIKAMIRNKMPVSGCAGLALVMTALVASVTGCKDTATKEKDDRILVTEQPQDQMVPEGASAPFTVGIRAEDAKFQWQFNGTNIPGATSATLGGRTNIGLYTCLITAGDRSKLSHSAGLFVFTTNSFGLLSSVQGPFRPYNPHKNYPCDKQNIEINGYCGVTNPTGSSPWFPVDSKTSCTADTFDVANCPYDTVLTSREFSDPNRPAINCNDDTAGPATPCGSNPHLSRLLFPVKTGERYEFTIYTKPPTCPPTGYVMKLNVNWTPP